ncbi:response regulator transcription factor [Jeotgalibaca sp. MA1X17-3]|uniref:response regulator transcription factor n=1 Tax=Jeotgalibaca sp. MA1X17-3 TaxID=2908211 RepID=UPI001F44FAD0|nr:response regulator transcription factor [Jeotgalibaca sp. MA1X17-3]UJF16257.1 response regulator transcription factor [Jeotgalibaca sp. MA1X17-3]
MMRLLLCEDEKELSDALVAILKFHNYSVDAVYDGEEALSYLESENYDGVILDIMMPKVDGISVLKEIRSKGNKVPVLLLTAKSEIDDKVLGLDTGADDYLTKPFVTKELVARVRAITRRQGEMTDSQISFANVILDRLTYELKSDKDTTKLSNKEFQVLEMLMVNPQNVIPTDRFMEKIWGYDSDSEINVVWVCISSLRKKLNTIGSFVEIKARRNIGYSLEEQ